MYHKDVCRTAPATPGLLNIRATAFRYSWGHSSRRGLMARWPSSAALSCRCPWTIVPGPGPYPGVPGHSSCPWPLGSCSLPLPEKCPWLGWVGLRLQVVVEELFLKAEYYPILLLDFSQFLSYYFFNNWIGVQKNPKILVKAWISQNMNKFWGLYAKLLYTIFSCGFARWAVITFWSTMEDFHLLILVSICYLGSFIT